jgi:hypothetical protein
MSWRWLGSSSWVRPDRSVGRCCSNRSPPVTTPVRVNEDGWAIDGCPDDGPSIAVDAGGVLHIGWPTLVSGTASGKGIFYSYSSTGYRWGFRAASVTR